ncbi:MAG: hypothetical protein IJW23_10570 [Lentisphaeria bacterium]|nr:hypothetical protein [Lentisphaeria bacterium]
MKLVWKCIILALAFIPFLWKFPVLIKTWKTYPANTWDPYFMAAAFVLCGILVWRRYKEGLSTDLRGGLTLAIPAAAVMIIGLSSKNMMLFYPGATLFAWSVLWIVFGWKMFYRLFPIPLMVLLSLPTTEFTEYFPGINLYWKLALASALCIYAFFALWTDFSPIRRRTAWFSAGVIIYAILYAMIPQ